MPLLDRSKYPPGNYPYREPSINWTAPHDGLGFDLKARQIQAARIQNPAAGLDPSIEACYAALDTYTCARLHNDPAWCVPNESQLAKIIEQARKPYVCCGGKRGKR